jgi:hypothetical protein
VNGWILTFGISLLVGAQLPSVEERPFFGMTNSTAHGKGQIRPLLGQVSDDASIIVRDRIFRGLGKKSHSKFDVFLSVSDVFFSVTIGMPI